MTVTVTKQQAMTEERFHYVGKRQCFQPEDGPRGGKPAAQITEVRASGKCKTWKRDLNRFHLPIKYGLYESHYIDQDNAHEYHVASCCNLRQGT